MNRNLKPGDLVVYYGSAISQKSRQRDTSFALIKSIESQDYIKIHWINGNPYWDNIFAMSHYYKGKPEKNPLWFWRKV
jgi:hypothetical protein